LKLFEAPLWVETRHFSLEIPLTPPAPSGPGNRGIVSLLDGAGFRPLLGRSATGWRQWHGEIQGLAFRDRALSVGEFERHARPNRLTRIASLARPC
jgi:hypothetical protein